jgi:hypothetical protein
MGWQMRYSVGALMIVLAVSAIQQGRAQTIRHDSGQDVAPAFEGWEKNADGSFNFVFGYLNRNYQEQVNIPIGPDNFFDPSPQDRGQPTYFYPRRQRFIFRVRVPKDWDKTRRLVWTLRSHGKMNQAKGWLQPEWELNPGVISENNDGGVLEPGNQPPTVTGSASATVALSDTITLTVTAADDGLPKPKPRRAPPPDSSNAVAAATTAAAAANPDSPVRSGEGLRVKWLEYRGPARAAFDPDSSKPEYKLTTTYTTTIKFREPGDYVIRALVSDGQLETTHDVKVTVQ